MIKISNQTLAGLWAGLSIAGSFVAAPAKFQAPSLTLPAALEVGRAQFMWLGIVELFIAVGFVFSVFRARNIHWSIGLAPVSIFILQRAAIMPVLDTRTLQIINGDAVPASALHTVFIILEVFKLAALLYLMLSFSEREK